MKKLFLLLPALILAMMVNATVTEINTSTYGSDNVRKALYYASPNDTIVLADGTYEESTSNYLAFDKNIVLMAAGNGAIIQTQVPVTITNGARAEIIGVKFNAVNMTGYSHLIYAADGSENNRLIMDGCDIYNYTVGKAVIAARSSNKLDSLIINNCKFYNHTTRSCVFLENTENKGLIVTNSTFYNIATGTESFGAGILDDRSTTAEVRVDHCSFYNVVAQNTDYAAIGKIKSSNSIVSNCIFMMPESTGSLRAIRDVATANNCLTYNYTYDSNWGIHGSVVKNNCIQLKDPAFVNAASGDFHITDASPAYLVGSDNKSLGAKCWWPAAPETDFATAYNLVGSKAGLVGNIRLNANSNIEYYDNSVAGTAVWEVKATRACAIQAVIDMETGSASGSIFQIKVYNEKGNEVGTFDASYKEDDQDINMSGTVYLPKAGVYTIKLFNNQSWSSAKVEKIILSYVGGAVQNIATDVNTTLPIAEAWFSGCTRDNDYIKYPSSGTADAWIKWNIATSETNYYDLTVNINTEYAHGFTVAVYEDEEAEPVTSVTEGNYINTKGVLALELGRINLAGDKNYVVKVTNAPSGSQAKVANVIFAPVVATATALPNTLAFSDAVLSEKAFIQDGMLYFNEIGDTNPQGQWAQWEVTTDHAGKFLFTLNATSENGQKYKITIYDNLNNEIASYEENFDSGDKTMKHFFELAAGNYFVKVENTRSFSKGHLTSLVVTEPEVITLDEAATSFTYQAGVKHYQLIRTLKAGMYNTFCSPLKLSSDVCEAVFGEDVEIYTLKEAVADGAVLNVELKSESAVWQGTPVFIRPSHDIVNPIFIEVEMLAQNPASTTKTNADLSGTFVKTALQPNQNILYLGPNNLLYYPEIETPIKGFRAWFVIHDTSIPAPALKRMNIVEAPAVTTEINFVESKVNASVKTIENGQLVIIRDNKKYNVMGIKIQ